MKKKLNVIENIIHDSNINITNLNEINNNILLKKYEELINNEPAKLFKKKHKIWEEEINAIKTKLDKSFDDLYDNYNDIEKNIR